MLSNPKRRWFHRLLFMAALFPAWRAGAQSVLYRLDERSSFLEDCPICARPPILVPLEGTFLLTLENTGDVTDWYQVDSVDFRAPGDREYKLSGSGTYLTRLGGSPGEGTHSMSLVLEVNGEAGIQFESGEVTAGAFLPPIEIPIDEQTSSLSRVYKLHIYAYPADTVAYDVLLDSFYVDDCVDCRRALIPRPIGGSFFLLKDRVDPVFTTYRIFGLDLQGVDGPFWFTGGGTYTIEGEVAQAQEMELQTSFTLGDTTRSPVILSSGGKVAFGDHTFPEISIKVKEKDPPDLLHIPTLQLVARPKGSVPPFRRGDSNGDGAVDLSDGVHVLFWLFLCGEEPGCLDASDSDGSEALDIGDAVVLITYLFLSGPEPSGPGPDACGQSLKTVLGCRSYGSCAIAH